MGQKEPTTQQQAAVADYIDDMTSQLAAMARANGLADRARALDVYLDSWSPGAGQNAVTPSDG